MTGFLSGSVTDGGCGQGQGGSPVSGETAAVCGARAQPAVRPASPSRPWMVLGRGLSTREPFEMQSAMVEGHGSTFLVVVQR